MATNADGSIVIGVNMNTDKAEKDLAKFKQKIEQTEREISDIRQKRDEARQKSAVDAGALDAEKAKLQEIKDRLADIRAMAGDKSLGVVTRENAKSLIPVVQQELEEQRERVRGLQNEWNKITSEAERYDQKLREAESNLEQQKEQAGALQQQINDAEQKRAEIVQNAEVSDRTIVELNRELLELKARQVELSQAGLGLGYKEFDQIAARISEITKALKDYQKESNSAGREGPSKPIDRTAVAADRLNSILSRTGDLFRTAGNIALTAFNAVSGVISNASHAFAVVASGAAFLVKGTVSIVKNMNALSKVSEMVGKKFRYISRMLKRTFVTFPLLKGLRAIRQQITSYLSANTALATSLNTLKGVFLTAFQPIYDVAVPALLTLVNVITRVVAAISEFTAVLFGTTAKKAQENAKALYSQANATSAAGSAAEEASLQMASFDEINQLQGNKSGGGGGGASADLGPSFDYEYEDTIFDSWGEAFSAFLDKILANIPKLEAAFKSFADGLNDFSKKLYDMFTFPGVLEKVEQIGRELAGAFNKLTDWINWNQLGKALGAGMNLALQFLTELIYGYNWINLGKKLAEFINGLASEIDWYDFGRLLWAGFKISLETLAGFLTGLNMPEMAQAASNIVKGFFDEMTNTISSIPWFTIGTQIAEFLNNIDWYGVITSVINAIQAALIALQQMIFGLVHNLKWDEIATQIYTTINDSLGKIPWKLLGKTLGDLFIHIFDFLRDVISGINWRQIGEDIRDFLTGIDWRGVAESVLGAIKAAFTASSDFFSGLLGEELKRILTDMLITISKYTLVLGALLALTGINVPLGMGLISVGAASLAAAAVLDWEYVVSNIDRIISGIASILGAALLVIGTILTLSGPTHIPLGISLMALGAVGLATAATINWDFIPNTISGVITTALGILSVAFLVLGAILTFSNANIPLGIGLMALGAVSLATALAINWDILPNTIGGIVSKVTAILSVAFLVLGAILTFTGANIPLGLGLLVVGVVGLATSIAANWDTIQPKIQGALDAVKAIASGALLALGVVLIFTGAAIPLGLGMIAIGALGLASLIDPNWGGILEKLKETWGNIKDWWNNGPSKYFKLDYWKGVAKSMVDGFLGGLQDIWSGLTRWASDVKNTIASAFSGASSGAAYTKAGKYQRTATPYSVSRASNAAMPKISSFNIPALAKGAVIPPNREFLAVLGDQKSGNNLEGPEASFEAAVARGIRAAGGIGGNRPTTVILQVDRRELGRVVYDVNNEETQRVGVRLTEART